MLKNDRSQTIVLAAVALGALVALIVTLFFPAGPANITDAAPGSSTATSKAPEPFVYNCDDKSVTPMVRADQVEFVNTHAFVSAAHGGLYKVPNSGITLLYVQKSCRFATSISERFLMNNGDNSTRTRPATDQATLHFPLGTSDLAIKGSACIGTRAPSVRVGTGDQFSRFEMDCEVVPTK